MQLTDTCNDLCCKTGRHFEFLLTSKMYSILNITLTSDYVIFGNTHHLSVACFFCDSLYFNQALAKTLKLCQKNCPKYIYGDFFLRHCGVDYTDSEKTQIIYPSLFPTTGLITSSTTRLISRFLTIQFHV